MRPAELFIVAAPFLLIGSGFAYGLYLRRRPRRSLSETEENARVRADLARALETVNRHADEAKVSAEAARQAAERADAAASRISVAG